MAAGGFEWVDFTGADFHDESSAGHRGPPNCIPNYAHLSVPISPVGLSPVEKEGSSSHEAKSALGEESSRISISCPNCKALVPLPPGTVFGMQDLMFMEECSDQPLAGAVPCDLCQESSEVKLQCALCRKYHCTRCRPAHDRLCRAKVASAGGPQDALVRQKSEPGVNGLSDTIAMLEKLLQTLTAEESWQEEPAALANDLGLGGEDHPPNSFGFQPRHDGEETDFKDDPHQQQRESESAQSLSRSRRESESAQSLSRSRRESESAWSLALSRCDSVLSQSTAVSLTSILKNSLEKQMETERVVGGLQQRVADLQQQNTLLCRDLAHLQERHGQHEREVLRERDSRASLERELVCARDDITALQNDSNKVQDYIISLQLAQETMASVHKLCRQVAFHAILSVKVRLQKRDVLVCDEVVSNVDGGYNAASGVFVAPVSGVYCFMATSSPGSDDEFAQCKLDLMVGERDVAFLSARGRTPCTTHAVVKVTAGHRAYLRANEEGKFAGGWRTSFTGVLVQPDL